MPRKRNRAAETAPVVVAPPPRLDRPARIGVIGPAGRVINRDEVVTWSYGHPERSLKSFTNIGDCFVYDSSLKIMDFSELVPITASETQPPTPEQIEAWNQLDFIFLRGSNYINTSGKWDPITAVLEKLKVPVIAFGIGVQVPENSVEFVNDSTRRFLQLISERSTTLAIRGELSERALRSIGIKNTRIIGCPTVFRHRQPELAIRRVKSDAIKELGFTLRRKTHGRYTLQRYMMRMLAEQYPMTVLCAGENEEKAIYYASRGLVPNSDAALQTAIASLVADGWIFGANDSLLNLYLSSLAVFESVNDFEERARQMTAVTGFRLHGNLISLANGVPALYVTYDTRTREFVDTLGIPFVDSRMMDKFNFREAWDAADFGKFERCYRERFGELRTFLEENNMPHRLETARAEALDAAE
jgi:polysaccharide pyruvyl transferase WcaK-like protein